MNISNYIESGIIERYLLGLTSPEQEEELLQLRRIYPLLDLEVTAAELRIEDKLMEEGTMPPAVLKEAILQQIRPDKEWDNRSWTGYNSHEHTNTHHTYIPIEPFWNRRISVSMWWRCAFIAMTVLTMSLAASTWHFYHRADMLEDILIRLKVPTIDHPAPNAR
ncbi:hypothetical protein [Chitinophaga arvensicola]|uniref:Uncharacterized protein n=1 Tax=Chitinophaga arvensicola TaxID=29529 RepID=A0A1I0P071_9BACT|nr:hypothetical protein [Chitinophaga arvensicola]SEW07642.1 hypothetical protein SAMN04488122_0486 [Chitinophaga arvensicola]